MATAFGFTGKGELVKYEQEDIQSLDEATTNSGDPDDEIMDEDEETEDCTDYGEEMHDETSEHELDPNTPGSFWTLEHLKANGLTPEVNPYKLEDLHPLVILRYSMTAFRSFIRDEKDQTISGPYVRAL